MLIKKTKVSCIGSVTRWLSQDIHAVFCRFEQFLIKIHNLWNKCIWNRSKEKIPRQLHWYIIIIFDSENFIKTKTDFLPRFIMGNVEIFFSIRNSRTFTPLFLAVYWNLLARGGFKEEMFHMFEWKSFQHWCSRIYKNQTVNRGYLGK